MDKNLNPQPENVISLFAHLRSDDDKKTDSAKNEAQAAAQDVFENAKLKNQEVTERLRKERAKANRSVLRSYRIKT